MNQWFHLFISGALLLLTIAVVTSAVDNSFYGSLLCSKNSMIDVQAYWPLEDLPTHDSHLVDRINIFRPARSIPTTRFHGHANSNGGSIEFRLDDRSAAVSKAIHLVYPAYLEFPLDPVRPAAAGPPTGSEGMFFTALAWFKFNATGSVSTTDSTPIFSIWSGATPEMSSVVITSSTVSFGGGTSDIAYLPFAETVGSHWHMLAVVVTETSAFVNVDVFIDGVLELSVEDNSTEWNGSSFRLSAPMWTPTIFDEVAVVASYMTAADFDPLIESVNRGACNPNPCFSGVPCTPLSSSRYQCGACPSGYTGNGTVCESTVFSRPISDRNACSSRFLDNPMANHCNASCESRASCYQCTFSKPGATGQSEGRSDCAKTFPKVSPSPTPTRTPVASRSPTKSASYSPTVTNVCGFDPIVRSRHVPNTPVYDLVPYGGGMWTNASNFADPTARWIWNAPNASENATTGLPTLQFQYLYKTKFCENITVHVIVDNAGRMNLDGAFVGHVLGSGWTTTEYTRFSVQVIRGSHLFEFLCINLSGPAGLLVAAIRDSDGQVLFHSDSTWTTW